MIVPDLIKAVKAGQEKARLEIQGKHCMNEKIRKLLNDATCGLEPDLSPQRTITLNEMEKFAELIVRECADHCDLLLDHKISSEWSRGTHDCSRAIKKHFGVEQ